MADIEWFGKEVEAQAIANMEAMVNTQLEKVREETARNWPVDTGHSLSILRRDPAKINPASISGRVIIPVRYAIFVELEKKVMRRALRKNEITGFNVF